VASFSELRNTIVVKKSEDRTRDQVARAILENGPSSAAILAKKLKITPAGIRRHLDALIASGVLIARDPYQTASDSRGRGRPSKVFVMTDLGREKFEHSYDDLAVSALRFMSDSSPNLVLEFAKARAKDLQKRALVKIESSQNLSEKSKALAKFLSDEGFAANNHSQGIGEELCQNHCPIAHVAAQFPELCEAETQAFSEILGTHVQRLATIAHGDGVCTTFIPKGPITQATSKPTTRKRSSR
jgi:predicted ArsR family transcriptional regulator